MILDTDILIDLDRKRPAAKAWFDALTLVPPVCGFSALELQQGCQNAQDLHRVEKLLLPFPIAWPTEPDMERTRIAYASLRLSQGVGIFDSLIASTAIGRGVPLATFNIKHYRHIPGLTTVKPYNRDSSETEAEAPAEPSIEWKKTVTEAADAQQAQQDAYWGAYQNAKDEERQRLLRDCLTSCIKAYIGLDVEPQGSSITLDGVTFFALHEYKYTVDEGMGMYIDYYGIHIEGRCSECGRLVLSPIIRSPLDIGRWIRNFRPGPHECR